MREITRQELYDIVWSAPMRDAATQFGISDVALAKTCRKAGIPLPPRGYWLKPEDARKVQKVDLPSRGIGQSDVIRSGKHYYSGYYPDSAKLIEQEIPPPPEFVEPIDAIFEKVRKLVGKVTVPLALDKVHPSIQRILDRDTERVQSGYSWSKPLFDSPFERRRLRIINAIFLACARLGAKPELSGKERFYLSVKVGDTSVGFDLDDPKQPNTDRYRDYRPQSQPDRPATDKLRLEISSWKECSEITRSWEDRPKDRIEKHISDVVVNILVAGEVFYRAGVASHHQWLVDRRAALIEEARRQKERAEEAERQKLIKEERDRVSRLLKQARDLRKANDIREYVRLVREQAVDNTPEAIEAWSKWALERAEGIDPVRGQRFLTDIDNPRHELIK